MLSFSCYKAEKKKTENEVATKADLERIAAENSKIEVMTRLLQKKAELERIAPENTVTLAVEGKQYDFLQSALNNGQLTGTKFMKF